MVETTMENCFFITFLFLSLLIIHAEWTAGISLNGFNCMIWNKYWDYNCSTVKVSHLLLLLLSRHHKILSWKPLMKFEFCWKFKECVWVCIPRWIFSTFYWETKILFILIYCLPPTNYTNKKRQNKTTFSI